jgi:uncharacterized protein (DUF1015 family)
MLAEAIKTSEVQEERDRMGGSHVLLPIFDAGMQRQLAEFFAARALFVADGHHRYEAALAYRNAQRKVSSRQDGPWEYVLALIAAVEDAGVIVRPTHRLVVGKPVTARPLLELLARWFDVAEDGPPAREDKDTALFRVMLADSPRPWVVHARPDKTHLALLPATRSEAWQSLAVSAVEGVVQSLFGAGLASGHAVLPVVDAGSAIDQVRAGRAAAAFLLPAPPLERLFAVAEAGDLLPPKSTWFEPKAPAGLVINDLSLSATE